jgi:hypothetical protein
MISIGRRLHLNFVILAIELSTALRGEERRYSRRNPSISIL